MAVRSAQLAVGALSSTSATTVYSVPAGRRTIVKDVRVFNGAGVADDDVRMLVRSGGSDRSCWRFRRAMPSAESDYIPQCWIVLDTGDELKLQCAQSTLRYVISGAELIE